MTNYELINKFQIELERIGGIFSSVENDSDAATEIIEIANGYNTGSIVLSGNPKLTKIHDFILKERGSDSESVLNIKNLDRDSTILREKLSNADIGVSYAYCIIAETGSAVLLSSRDEPRSLSLLPAISIIIANSETVVPELADAIKMLQDETNFVDLSCMTIISGPSRTADIEKVLVTGVHGPKNLHVILI
jgi:L-lactate utilization protein LutC